MSIEDIKFHYMPYGVTTKRKGMIVPASSCISIADYLKDLKKDRWKEDVKSIRLCKPKSEGYEKAKKKAPAFRIGYGEGHSFNPLIPIDWELGEVPKDLLKHVCVAHPSAGGRGKVLFVLTNQISSQAEFNSLAKAIEQEWNIVSTKGQSNPDRCRIVGTTYNHKGKNELFVNNNPLPYQPPLKNTKELDNALNGDIHYPTAVRVAGYYNSLGREEQSAINVIKANVKTSATLRKDGVVEKLVKDIYKTYQSQFGSLSKIVQTQFFYRDKKGEKTHVNKEAWQEYFKEKGYHRYANSISFDLVQVVDNRATEISLDHALGKELDLLVKEEKITEAQRLMLSHPDVVKLPLLEESQFLMDDENIGYMFYRNCVLVYAVKKKSFEIKDYKAFKDKLIWQEEVTDRDFKLLDLSGFINGESTNCIFCKFLQNVFIHELHNIKYVMEVLGYMLHTYRRESDDRYVGLFGKEEQKLEDASGRVGKSILAKSFDQIIEGVRLPGKTWDINSQFAYQTLNRSTKVVLIDDYPHTQVPLLYNISTMDITVQKKNQHPWTFAKGRSPKFVVTLQKIPDIESASTRDRILPLLGKNYYRVLHPNAPQPIVKEHGVTFYSDDWTGEQWLWFDNMMAQCKLAYFQSGLKMPDPTSVYEQLKGKKVYQDYRDEFIAFYNSVADGAPHSLMADFLDNKDLGYRNIRAFTNDLRKMALLKGHAYKSTPKDATYKEEVWIKDKHMLVDKTCASYTITVGKGKNTK